MPNYQNGKIYTIRCRNDDSLIYVGSTCETLSRRMATHRGHSKERPHLILYEKVNGNWGDWYIELYEECPCNTKEELRKREGEVIREIGTLNKYIAGRSGKEWENDNKDRRMEYYKLYDNRPEVIEKKIVYRENTKEQRKVYDTEYWEKNKAKRQEQQKEWRLKNKDKIKEYMRQYHLKKNIR